MACDTQENINFILEQLNNKPQIVKNVIKFINSISWNELKSLGVLNQRSIIIEVSKVLVKKNLVQKSQDKCDKILQDNGLFMNRYKKLVNLGLKSCWDKNVDLIPFETYEEMLILEKNNTTKFNDLEGTLKGKYIVDQLKDDIELLWSTKLLF